MIKVAPYLDLFGGYNPSFHKWNEIKQEHFPDGTLLLKTDHINMSMVDILWQYENDAELFAIICLAKKANTKRLIMPYCPHARQDRVKRAEDTFTLKYFAEVINSLGFESVEILDPHSNVCTALIDRVRVKSPLEYINKAITEINDPDLVMFYPDSGAAKRYSEMIKKPYAYGIKNRDWETGKILGLDVIDNGIDMKGKKVLITDDISSRGGTFFFSAKKLKELGVGDIYLYVTHCENTILKGEVLTSGLIEKVFTTNSLFTGEHEKIKVFDLD